MKIKLEIFATLLSFALLTIYTNGLNAGQDEAQDTETPGNCEGDCRTWVVFRSTTQHMAEGDKFQISELESLVEFVALSQLKEHWNRNPMNPLQLPLTQIEVGPNKLFCGFVDILSNEHPSDMGHMFKIKKNNDNMLQITWMPYHSRQVRDLDEAAQKEECEKPDESKHHGGVAHAEPN